MRSDPGVFKEFAFAESTVNVPKKLHKNLICVRLSQFNFYSLPSIFNSNIFQFQSPNVELIYIPLPKQRHTAGVIVLACGFLSFHKYVVYKQ